VTESSPDALDAVVFDLYGTLLTIGRKTLHREVHRLLGAPREAWARLVREELLLRSFPDAGAFAQRLLEVLRPGVPEAARACRAAVDAEVASIRAEPGVPALLRFLRRRGLRLGVLSNLASPHAGAFGALGLGELVDAAAFSCEEKVAKPDPEIYRRLLSRLGAAADRALMVGDSLANDVEAPAALGFRTVGVRVTGRDGTVPSAAALGLWDLSRLPIAPLVAAGGELLAFDERLRVEHLSPVEDDEQGRYNLVFAADVADAGGQVRRVFLKRFLFPETTHVEAFAYRLQAATGLPACRADVLRGPEPLLVLSQAPGRKFAGDLGPGVAYELGRHFVFALLFANADIRPRNAFLDQAHGRTVVTLVDLEHCFFNLAIDTDGLAEPFRPETFDRMAPEELRARRKKEVLTRRATSRARRSFFGDTPKGSEIDRAFRDGFLDFYGRQRARSDELCELLWRRTREEPPLVIGTHGYRRALAGVDVEDIRERILRDPEEAYEWAW
jgi:HAD superfamily hydrolase (TIGR01509 family)